MFIGKLAKRRAPRLDQVANLAVLILLREHPKVFKKMMRGILQSGDLPREWRQARLVLIPKGPKNDKKYRPISLLSTLAKAAEHIINNRLNDFLEDHIPLSPRQHGFI